MSDEKKQTVRILLKRRAISPDELDRQLRRSARRRTVYPSRRVWRRAASSPRPTLACAVGAVRGARDRFDQIAVCGALDLVPREVAESSRLMPCSRATSGSFSRWQTRVTSA
jgi:hypothetical protein